MTLEEAVACLQRDHCLGCKFHDTDESCLETAIEVAIGALNKMIEMEEHNGNEKSIN